MRIDSQVPADAGLPQRKVKNDKSLNGYTRSPSETLKP